MMAPNLDGVLGLAALSLITLPFALWKWIEIVIWILSKVTITWG